MDMADEDPEDNDPFSTLISTELATLKRAGQKVAFNPLNVSRSTLLSTASHINTIRRTFRNDDFESFADDTVGKLNRLVDKKQRPLKAEYKRQIGMTIKRMLPDRIINLKPFYRQRDRKDESPAIDDKKAEDVLKVINKASEIIRDVSRDKFIEDLGLYETCIAACITVGSNLRINEIKQLKRRDFDDIKNDRPISLKIKNSNDSHVITRSVIFNSTLDRIDEHRKYVEENVRRKKTDFTNTQQRNRLILNYAIISSISYMRRRLRDLAALAGLPNRSVTFNLIRKLGTSTLIENGAHDIAQKMSHHSHVDTTTRYNIPATTLANRTQSQFNPEQQITTADINNLLDEFQDEQEFIDQLIHTDLSAPESTAQQ